MIRNLVFDMGNVLLRWDPQRIVSDFTQDAEAQEALLNAIFRHPDWALQDAGTVSEAELREHALNRLPEKWHAEAEACLADYEHHVTHIQETLQLAAEARNAGLGVYVLSNAAERFWNYLHTEPDFSVFQGVLISAMEKLVKPDMRIYWLAAERFGVQAEECVFIDDIQANVDGAISAGMRGIRFDGDIIALRSALREMGVPVTAEGN